MVVDMLEMESFLPGDALWVRLANQKPGQSRRKVDTGLEMLDYGVPGGAVIDIDRLGCWCRRGFLLLVFSGSSLGGDVECAVSREWAGQGTMIAGWKGSTTSAFLREPAGHGLGQRNDERIEW